MRYFGLLTTALATSLWAQVAVAQNADNHEGITAEDVASVIKPEFSPYAGRNFPTRPLFGDTHLHTAVSVDAGTLNRLGQEDAYRFARGEEVLSTGGLRAKLGRPLDFLVIADHAEMYGLMPQLLSGDPEILSTDVGQKWYAALTSGNLDTDLCHSDGDRRVAVRRRATHQERKPSATLGRPTRRWPIDTMIQACSPQ